MYSVLEANHIRYWGHGFIEALTRPGVPLNWLSSRGANR
jgi:trehalose 6-phosphate synthase